MLFSRDILFMSGRFSWLILFVWTSICRIPVCVSAGKRNKPLVVLRRTAIGGLTLEPDLEPEQYYGLIAEKVPKRKFLHKMHK